MPTNPYGILALSYCIYTEAVEQASPLSARTHGNDKIGMARRIGLEVNGAYDLLEITKVMNSVHDSSMFLMSSRICTGDNVYLCQECIEILASFVCAIELGRCPASYRDSEGYSYMDNIEDEDAYWREFPKYVNDMRIFHSQLPGIYERLVDLLQELDLQEFSLPLQESILHYVQQHT